jgi:hypothetical protein
VLIEYLTLNYIFVYFWNAIWLFYQLIIHACSEAIFRENIFSANFPPVSDFLCEVYGRTYSCVRTRGVLPIANLVVHRPDECVPRPDVFFSGILFAAYFLCHSHCTTLFSYFCHVLSFSRRFLLRFWHSLDISSHFIVFIVSSFVLLKFLCFLEYWNIFLRYCAWKSFFVCVLGWYWYIWIIGIAIFAFVILVHPNCKLS